MVSIGLSAEEINFSNRLSHLLDEEEVQMPDHSREKTVIHIVKIFGCREVSSSIYLNHGIEPGVLNSEN